MDAEDRDPDGGPAQGLYITATDAASGKTVVALGVAEAMSRRVRRLGVFRPVVPGGGAVDELVDLIRTRYRIEEPYEDCVGTTYDAVHLDPARAVETIVDRYRALAARCEAVVVVGSDYTDAANTTEFGFNANVAANLALPVLLVVGGMERTPQDVAAVVRVSRQELTRLHATELAVVVNRVQPGDEEAVRREVAAALGAGANSTTPLVFTIPEVPGLTAPTIRDLVRAADGELISGEEALLDREAASLVVAAMSLPNVLDRLTEGVAIIAPGDRTAGLVPGLLAAHEAANFPALSGVFLTGGFTLPASVSRLLEGVSSPLPIIASGEDTLPTALHLAAVRGEITAGHPGKVETALGAFARGVDTSALLNRLNVTRSVVVTPLMFQAQLLERARSQRRRIVLPEGGDDRILRAADIVARRGAADLIVLGEEEKVRARANALGLDLAGVRIVSPADPDLVEEFAHEYTALRAHKGMTLDKARDIVQDASYFGTMMVHSGRADGMVSGAVHTTAHTIRPAFEIIRTEPGVSVVSSVFFMLLADRVLVYGDCAVIPDPDAGQLADIAVSSARTAEAFGVRPRVAMLSYSSGESGSGEDVEKVREAAKLAHERDPDLLLEGPIQYDAAADPEVAALKLPGSVVAGRATVFIVPDLNTGNNLYKAVQRSAGAIAVGPVLQGLRKPVNDLSRGALVQDIVNTIVITAVQAQGPGGGVGVGVETGPASSPATGLASSPASSPTSSPTTSSPGKSAR
ncbi:phosphate acetyltransferase [Catenulispora pinisilvae]|uniref:phosphate acetyltransferase n=1 Tax=Catenulispora pinisilvae TaxID=2705253 RepID=UPI002B264C3A|nr:phosphate acetyltransferase [Catenulispora pinisilvae]